jgi:murein DD-endopeptidase MepM/ murein hydrolase activator NlpD
VHSSTTLSRSRLRTVGGAAMAALLTACGAAITPLQPRGTAPVPVAATAPSDAPLAAYFDANPLMVPVLGVAPARIPDSFNEPRDGGRIHRATDILVPQGTPVLAAESGTVLRLSENKLGGTTIYMTDDGGRFIYYYAHLLRYADGLAAGAHVWQGDVLGYVGMTGNAPVPHLHFQVMRRETRRDYWNGTAVDVRPFFTLVGRARTNDAEQGAGESSR